MVEFIYRMAQVKSRQSAAMIQKALETWYNEGHPLRNDPRHPLIKLAGESGEILDLFGKHEYKPGFDWMDCKCGKPKDSIFHTDSSIEIYHEYVPRILDELGDYWYYLRILAWQQNLILKPGEFWDLDMLNLLASLASYSTQLLEGYLSALGIPQNYILICYDILLGILFKLNCSIDGLTDLNYKKLNSYPTHYGWVGEPRYAGK